MPPNRGASFEHFWGLARQIMIIWVQEVLDEGGILVSFVRSAERPVGPAGRAGGGGLGAG